MIHHISIDARDPLHVAGVLAEIWNGKVYKFLVPSSYIMLPFDNYGTHIVVLKAGDVWSPGNDLEAAKVIQTIPTNLMAIHTAISVPSTQQQIEQIGQREGWRVLNRNRGDNVPFSAIELWVENRLLFELFTVEFLPEYLQIMQPEAIGQILGNPKPELITS
jgi:hypothetical protein